MMRLYTMPGCASCKRIKQYCKEYEIEYEERNLVQTLLNEKWLDELLHDFNARRHLLVDEESYLWKLCQTDLQSASLEQLKLLFKESPSLLRKPVIDCDDEEILAHALMLAENACRKSCGQYDTCARLK